MHWSLSGFRQTLMLYSFYKAILPVLVCLHSRLSSVGTKNESSSVYHGTRWFFRCYCLGLTGDYIGSTGTFFALSNLEFHPLPFIKRGIAVTLDFPVMNEQIIAGVIGLDKSKAFFPIKPFYCTLSHFGTPSACKRP